MIHKERLNEYQRCRKDDRHAVPKVRGGALLVITPNLKRKRHTISHILGGYVHALTSFLLNSNEMNIMPLATTSMRMGDCMCLSGC